MPAAKRRKVTASGPPVPVPVVKSKRDSIYDACMSAKPVGAEFTTAELLSFDNIAIDEDGLGVLCQELLDRHLFSPWLQRGQSTMYRTRSKEDALKLAKLSADNVMIYMHVEGSGRSGIWKRTLSLKTNLHENTVTKGLNELMKKSLIKEVRTAKNTSKRIYILHHLTASDESTGGSFYTDGELDTGMVHHLNDWIVDYVTHRSWLKQPEQPHSTKHAKRKHDVERTSAGEMRKVLDGDRPLFLASKLVPQPSDFEAYPTVDDIMGEIRARELLKDITLSRSDVNQLVLQLVYDERLEEMSDGRYRSVRKVWDRKLTEIDDRTGPLDPDIDGIGPGNGLSQVPCGRCPVASDCRIGGQISPDTCVYMDEWLQF